MFRNVYKLQLSCVAVTATTVAKSLFPTLIKVNQGTELLSPFRIKLMEYFGWTRVGSIVYQDDISVSVRLFSLFYCSTFNIMLPSPFLCQLSESTLPFSNVNLIYGKYKLYGKNMIFFFLFFSNNFLKHSTWAVNQESKAIKRENKVINQG